MASKTLTRLVFTVYLIFQFLNGTSQQTATTINNSPAGTLESNKYISVPVTSSPFAIEPKSAYHSKFDSVSFATGVIDSSGIYTFRGSNQRNSPVRGYLKSRPSEILDSWIFTTGSDTTKGDYGTWGGGAGWTGQPLVLKWNKEELRTLTGLLPSVIKKDSSLTEIIQVSLAGKIYFLDFETGRKTRKPIEINNPIKGTPSVDEPSKRWLLSGQGIQNRDVFAWWAFDLRTQKLIHKETMPSGFALRPWGACDATPLIDPVTKTFFWPTESGVFYRGFLEKDRISSIEQYRYQFSQHPKLGTESSPSAYKNLVYITDNSGNIMCIDIRTMKSVWYFFNTDDTDGSPVIDIEDGIPYVYVGHEVDLQGSKGQSHLRKLNGLTGKMVWEYEKDCYSVSKPKTDNGGMLCTPLAGSKKAQGLIWTIFSKTTVNGGGSLVCLNTSDGSLKYEIKLRAYSWVSPIALYDRMGNAYVYFADVAGNVFLVDGESGEIIYKRNLDYIFESSPVAIGNRIIQPARGNRILSFIIR